jgi:hypothetical protein
VQNLIPDGIHTLWLGTEVWRLMEAEILLSGMRPEGSQLRQVLAGLSHDMRFCEGSDSPFHLPS